MDMENIMSLPGDKMGVCPKCGNEDAIYLLGEVKLQLTQWANPRAHFYLEDVYPCPTSSGETGKFRCENCGCIFNNPEWI